MHPICTDRKTYSHAKLHKKWQTIDLFVYFFALHEKFLSKKSVFRRKYLNFAMEKQPLNRIKVMLAERMLTNKQLAEMLGKDPATISKWVTNTSQPTLENLIEIARCLKCDMNDLVRLDDVVPIKNTKQS